MGKSSSAGYKRFVPEGFETPDGPDQWIDAWTMFYWGWWISWSPFVGKMKWSILESYYEFTGLITK